MHYSLTHIRTQTRLSVTSTTHITNISLSVQSLGRCLSFSLVLIPKTSVSSGILTYTFGVWDKGKNFKGYEGTNMVQG